MSDIRLSAQTGTTYGSEYTDKYSVEAYTFPEDLFNNKGPYGNSWVMININAQDISNYSSLYKKVVVSENKDFSNTRRTNLTGNEAAALVVGGATLGSAVKGATTALKTVLNRGKAAAAGAVGEALANAGKTFAVSAFAAAPFVLSGQANRKTSRIDTAIQLPMPSELITGYTMEWGESDTALLNAALRLGQSGVSAISGAFSGDMSQFKQLGSEAAEAAVAGSLATGSFLGSGAISAASGLAHNPKKEMIFNGVGFRNFSLTYRLYPKSASDLAKLYAIINTFKFHMHPEYKSEGRYTFIYPSEFDISFMHQENENFWVNRIATSVLRGMTVNYTPDGLWAQKGGTLSGAPNAVQLTLNFQELSILTKETIALGY